MINEKDLLIYKLKDTAVEELKRDFELEIIKLYEKQKEEFNNNLYEYLSKFATKYFSTTEIRRVWSELCSTNRGLIFFTDGSRMNSIDEYLDLSNPPMPNHLFHKRTYNTHITSIYKSASKSASKSLQNGKQLANALHRLNGNKYEDKRKMRRLERKEAKLKKKGIRLFDSDSLI